MYKRNLILIIILIASFLLLLSEKSMADSMTRESVTDSWGSPIRYGNTVCIYHKGNQFLIAVFDNSDATISDYVIIDSDRIYVDGTIERSFTIDFVLHSLFHDMEAMLNRSFDNGSGTIIHTVITSDGYVVEWSTENTYNYWFLFGGDCRIIDSISEDHASFAYQNPVEFYIKHHIMHIH